VNAIDFSRHWALTAPAPQTDLNAPASVESDDAPRPASEEAVRQWMLSWFLQQMLFPDPDDPASPPTFNPDGTW
jgi:hypothetical protein